MDEKVDAPGAVGGVAGIDSFSVQFDELNGRMQKLSRDDRRRALLRLSDVYQGELNSTFNENVQTQIVVKDSVDKLPPFSGASKFSQGEVSFKKWYRVAKRLLENTSVSEDQKKSSILKSLRGQADEIGDLYSAESAEKIVDVLSAQYGSLSDGEELLIEFYNLNQSSFQSASDYLSQLFVKLGEVEKCNGANVDDINKLLLRQFLRGCSDDDLLLRLKLEESKDQPLPYSEFIALVRREEARRMERKFRLKAKAKVQAVVDETSKKDDEVKESMQQKISQLEKELAELRGVQQSAEQSVQAARSTSIGQVKFPIFCYRCGQDKHKANVCWNNPNPDLVKQKVEQRRASKPLN